MHILALISRDDDVEKREDGSFGRNARQKFLFSSPPSLSLFIFGAAHTQAQRMSATLMQLIFDESISN
jgi:hypothetical protein